MAAQHVINVFCIEISHDTGFYDIFLTKYATFFRLHGIWGRLSGNDDLEETWKLSYTSSTNFKWLLQSVNVAFEKIVVSWSRTLPMYNSKDLLFKRFSQLGSTRAIKMSHSLPCFTPSMKRR